MAPGATPTARYSSAIEAREIISAALELASRDPIHGPILAAAGVSMRVELDDIDVAVDITSDPEGDATRGYLHWSFADEEDLNPELRLVMDSETGNRYLQGSQSLPVAIARGQVNVSGNSRMALFCLPAAQFIAKRYREVLVERYPHLQAPVS